MSLKTSKRFRTAARLCPPEIWAKIFSNVTNSAELNMIYKACKFFGHVLQPRKTSFMFENVFSIIRTRLSEEGVLKLRLVCTAWKMSVDGNLRSQPHLGPIPKTSRSPMARLHTAYRFENTFQNYLKPRQFLSLMETHGVGCNPFINAFVVVNFTPVTETEMFYDMLLNNRPDIESREHEFWNDIRQLFSKYGEHVAYLKIKVQIGDNHEGNVRQISQFLHSDLARLFPNLKKLRICGWLSPAAVVEDFIWPNSIGKPVLETLEFKLIRGWMPMMHQCRFFSMLASNVARLSVSWNVWQNKTINSRQWNNLAELQLVDIDRDFRPEMLTNAHIPGIRKLGLLCANQFSARLGCRFKDIIEAVACVCQIADKLHSLVLSSGFSLDQLVDAELAPSSIQNLEIIDYVDRDCVSAFSFTFVSHFLHVQNLRIVTVESSMGALLDATGRVIISDTEPETVDVLDLHKCITGKIPVHTASAWNILPRLSTLTLKNETYFRQ